MSERIWKIWIDTGGTFTDCLACNPDGQWQRIKVLSNGSLRARVTNKINSSTIKVSHQWPVSQNIFSGYKFSLLSNSGVQATVTAFDSNSNELILSDHIADSINVGDDFDITAGEEAPILAARIVTQTYATETLPPITMKLGSTKGTNALLERKGAKVAFLVTKGFKDLLAIGTQQRPDLFSLKVEKPAPIYNKVFEIPERIDAKGKVIKALSEKELTSIAEQLEQSDCNAVAIALFHSYKNPIHEKLLFDKLIGKKLPYVSCSHQLAPAIKIVPRANTAVINAYLDPIINNYLEGINKNLNNGTLKIMTSAGGIVNHRYFNPKDSLLSGPAGGVVGAAMTGNLVGKTKLISFDMGGTSTDVSRFDGEFDYQYETKIGDASLLSPTLSIETVAAGGGSICYFDDYKLKVGPESAGAHPGPACYGCGGPLTITDVNYILGRLDDMDFSIPLNKAASEAALDKIVAKMNTSAIAAVDKMEVLQGFLVIANEMMAETIKKISIARGFDPSDYTLMAFGGAGAQHACDLANLLTIKDIIIPYNAGILSAYGIGNAAIERYAQAELLQPLEDVRDDLPRLVEHLKKEATEKIKHEGIEASGINIKYIKLFLRILGQDTSLAIDYEGGKSIEDRFFDAYENLFHHRSNKKNIEVESVKCIASYQEIENIPNNKSNVQQQPEPINYISSYQGNGWEEIPVYRWESLPAGYSINGSCLVLSENSTVFVKKGWTFYLDENDNVVLSPIEVKKETTVSQSERKELEAISLELFTNRFRGLVDEMGALLQRTAFSVNIKERLDFSCALLDRHGELIVNAPHIPVHLGSLGICVRSLAENLKMDPGDVIITNHPAYGGSHLPDITLVKPVFDKHNMLIGYVANRAHHAELGGTRPGSMPPNAKNLAEEGVIINPDYLVKNGEVRWVHIEHLLTSQRYPSRSVEENIADLRAGLAALNQGEQALMKMVQQYGLKVIQNFMQAIKDRSENIIKNALKDYEGKSYTAKEKLDDEWEIKVTIQVKNGHAFLDFNGTSSQHPGNFNATPAIVNSAILYVFRLMTAKDIPLNEGIMKAFTVNLPPSFLNPVFSSKGEACPAVVGGNTETSQRLVDTLIKGFNLSACSQGTMNNLLFGNQKFGYYETIGGGVGAMSGSHGASAVHQHMTNTRITDPEIMELRYPVRLEKFAIRHGSGGSGKWHGGNGIERVLVFLEEIELTVLTQHRIQQPFGAAGGSPGKTGKQYVIRNNSELIPLSGVDAISLGPFDKVVIKTPGGGGFGKQD